MKKNKKLADILKSDTMKIASGIMGFYLVGSVAIGGITGIKTYTDLNDLKKNRYEESREIAKEYINNNTFNPIAYGASLGAEYFLEKNKRKVRKKYVEYKIPSNEITYR